MSLVVFQLTIVITIIQSQKPHVTRLALRLCLCSKKAVDDVVNTGKICILDLEEQGVKNVKRTALDARYIFIKPPSMAALVSVVCSCS